LSSCFLLPIKHRLALFHPKDCAGLAVAAAPTLWLTFTVFMSYLNLHFICKVLSIHRPRSTSIMSERATITNLKHLPKSILHLKHQMHMPSIFSELGNAGITVNSGIYFSHKK
jgi:hypothetical protein